tara:strand:- start:9469 stop:10005 length:537 start_codon:yes stop_codon:yes gene_type:complete
MSPIKDVIPATYKSVELRDWQQIVYDCIDDYTTYTDSQGIQSLNDFDINKYAAIQINLRSGAGHTWMAAFLATRNPTAVVYFDIDHYKEMEILAEARESEENKFHDDSSFISMFELRHDILLTSKSDWAGDALVKLKCKFKDKKVIVIDRATELRERAPETVNFIFQIADNTPIVMLG